MGKYNYCAYPEANETAFKKLCNALESVVANISKGDLLIDVDDSKLQFYAVNGAEIVVKNSYYIGAIYIESDVDLAPVADELKRKLNG